jgi:hypothetical protein
LQLPAALEVKPFDKPKMITLAGECKLIEEIMLDDSFASAAASLARPARSFLEGPTSSHLLGEICYIFLNLCIGSLMIVFRVVL